MTTRRFEHLRRVSNAKSRLLLFHYAGASASVFRPWLELLSAELDVVAYQLPGRDERHKEPLLSCIADVVHDALADVVHFTDLPLVFYGHSIGALIAFETIRALRAGNLSQPEHLIVSGRRAPHLPPPILRLHTLPDTEFVERLQAYGGTPEAVLRDPEVMSYFLPRLRADFAISETYRFQGDVPLSCPITAMAGDRDSEASADSVYPWRHQTTGPFQFHRMHGGHFFIANNKRAVLDVINGVVARCLPSSSQQLRP